MVFAADPDSTHAIDHRGIEFRGSGNERPSLTVSGVVAGETLPAN